MSNKDVNQQDDSAITAKVFSVVSGAAMKYADGISGPGSSSEVYMVLNAITMLHKILGSPDVESLLEESETEDVES